MAGVKEPLNASALHERDDLRGQLTGIDVGSDRAISLATLDQCLHALAECLVPIYERLTRRIIQIEGFHG